MKREPIDVRRPRRRRGKGSKRKIFQRDAAGRNVHLVERDRHLLEALERHRFLSAYQIQRLVFRTRSAVVQRRLRLLFDGGFVDRIPIVGHPQKGIPPLVYAIGPAGSDAIGIKHVPSALKRAGLRFVFHNFLVREFYTVLTEASRQAGIQVTKWLYDFDLKATDENRRSRRETVRHPELRSFNRGRGVALNPDAYFELEDDPRKPPLCFFFELDLATHSHEKWRERATFYPLYRQLGCFRKRFGHGKRDNFRLLIVTTRDFRGRSRRDQILGTIRKTAVVSDMFLATTLPNVQTDTVLRDIWRLPDGQSTRLVEPAPVRVRKSRRVIVTR